MAQITWRNVDAPDLSNAVRTQQLAVKNFQDALTNIAAIPEQTAKNVQAGIDRTDTTLLNNFVSNLNKMDSSAGIEKAEADGTFDNLLAGVTDEKQLKAKDAVQTQLDTILGREKNKQALDIAAAQEADRAEGVDYEKGQRTAKEAQAAATLKGQELTNKVRRLELDNALARRNAELGINAGILGVESDISENRKQYVATSMNAATEASKNGGMKSDFKIERLLNPYSGALDLNAVKAAFPGLEQQQKFLDTYGKLMQDPKVEALRISLSMDSVVGRRMAVFRKNNPRASASEIEQAQKAFEDAYTRQTTGSPTAKAEVARQTMAILDREAPTSLYARNLRENLKYGVSGLSEFMGTEAGMKAAEKLSKLHVRAKDVLESYIADHPDLGISEYLELVNKAVSLSPGKDEWSSSAWSDYFDNAVQGIKKREAKNAASATSPAIIDSMLAEVARGSPSLNPGADHAKTQAAIQAGKIAVETKAATYTANPIAVGNDIFGPLGKGNRASTIDTYTLKQALKSIGDPNAVSYKMLDLALQAKQNPKNTAEYFKKWQKLTLSSNTSPDIKGITNKTNALYNLGKGK